MKKRQAHTAETANVSTGELEEEFEKFQRMSDEPVAECPECWSRSERRLSGGAGFLFKGSGFYITDNRSDNYKKAEKEEKLEPWKKPGAIPESKGPGKASDSSTSTTSE